MKHKRLTLLLATLLLTGCTGTAQVQNRAFVQLLGADADRNANRVTAVSFGMEEPASGTGETLLTALEAAQCRYDRALMLGHTQVLVCGKGELEQRLSLLLDGNRISPGCRLVCADNAAKVLEETGAVGKDYRFMGIAYPSPGCYKEELHLYACRVASLGEYCPDEDEFLDVEKIPLDEAVAMCMRNEIPDAKTQILLLKVARLVEQGEL